MAAPKIKTVDQWAAKNKPDENPMLNLNKSEL